MAFSSKMEPFHWIPEDVRSLLDVGCNVGEFLKAVRHRSPGARLAGIDINPSAVKTARAKVPDADIQLGPGYRLPFEDQSFEWVTCIEVIEHIPSEHRAMLLSEIQRVLVPGGKLVLRCPHAGTFDWLDAQNLRFRFPKLYQKLVGKGNRDSSYQEAAEELVWHHHFTQRELIELAGDGWHLDAREFGAFLLFPISDILRWPFYRRNRWDHWMARALEKTATLELGVSFGKFSYGILLLLQKQTLSQRREPEPTASLQLP